MYINMHAGRTCTDTPTTQAIRVHGHNHAYMHTTIDNHAQAPTTTRKRIRTRTRHIKFTLASAIIKVGWNIQIARSGCCRVLQLEDESF